MRANVKGKDKMLLFAISTLGLTVLSLACAVQCVLNFDHDLKSDVTESGKLIGSHTNFRPSRFPSLMGGIHAWVLNRAGLSTELLSHTIPV